MRLTAQVGTAYASRPDLPLPIVISEQDRYAIVALCATAVLIKDGRLAQR